MVTGILRYSGFLCVALVLIATSVVAGESSAQVPAELPPLPDNWKKLVYDGLTKGMKKNQIDKTKYLFLDAPVPCDVTQFSKIAFSPMKKQHRGYGGLVAVRSKGLMFEGDRLHLYLIDAEGELSLSVRHMDMQFYETNPKLFTRSTEHKSNSVEVTVIPHIGPDAMRKLAAFRKSKLPDLPAYE